MKKLEQFWRENAVGIGLYNKCALWWAVRFERLLAALKSKRHKQAQICFVVDASVRWAFGLWNYKHFSQQPTNGFGGGYSSFESR